MARILVAEDDVGCSATLRRMLERTVHEVVPADNGAEALVRLEQGTFDLVLVDVHMPGRDGFEMLAEFRRRKLAPRVIVMSGGGFLGSELCARISRALGTPWFLTKPFGSEELLRAVDAALGGPGWDEEPR